MRTTLKIDDDLLETLKKRARDEGIPLGQLIERVLRAGLEAKKPPRRRVRIKTVDLGRPRIDLDKALHAAATLEDEEIVRKLAMRK